MYKQIQLLDHHIISGEDSLKVFNALFSSGDYKFRSFFILTDHRVSRNCLPLLKDYLPSDRSFPVLRIASGETQKSIDSCRKIWDFLSMHEAGRDAVLINLGGGMITDLGGFAASTYKRGISFIHIPTTLMGMVDAAIGGKTAINLQWTKNIVGTFAQPEAVFVFPEFLNTLPKKHITSGYAEVLKHALIGDKKLWDALKKVHIKDIQNWADLITLTLLIKAEIVARDPQEKGERKVLNLGHTFGHAFESLFMEKKLPINHGLAVAAGILCEIYLSRVINKMNPKAAKEIEDTLKNNFLLPKITPKDNKRLKDYMLKDKKNQQGKINCTLLDNIGKAQFNQLIPEELIDDAITYYASLRID